MAINDGRVVSNFIVQVLTNQPITIHGEGEQIRNFRHVDDLLVEDESRAEMLPPLEKPRQTR